VLEVAELGQVSVTYLREELPLLGLAQPPARGAGELPVALACSCDTDRFVVTAYFGTGWEGITVRLVLCRRGGVPEVVGIDLIGSNDYSAPWLLPPATGSVLLRRDVPGELACAFDLKSVSGGRSFVASGVIELAQCAPLDDEYGRWNPDTPLPECGAD
jgi:hypothetical protein